MRRLASISVSLAIAALATGCMAPMGVAPSGVSPGALMSDVNYPSLRESSTQFKFSRSDITILGQVKAEGQSRCILLLWASGDNGYGNLLKEAKRVYPDADGVVDIQWDTRYNNLCIPCCDMWIPILFKSTSVGEGSAFKFNK